MAAFSSQKAIFVIGMHRSGTSAVAGALHAAGVYFGDDLLPASPSNEKGFFEHRELVQVHEEILAALNHPWHHPEALPWGWLHDPVLLPFRQRIKEILIRDFSGRALFALKDPRLALLLPLYWDILEELGIEAYVVVVKRNLIEVARSLKKQHVLSFSHSIELFRVYERAIEYAAAARPSVTVSFSEFVQQPGLLFDRMQERFGLSMKADGLDVARGIAFVEPALRHYHFADEELLEDLEQAFLCASQENQRLRWEIGRQRQEISFRHGQLRQKNQRIVQLKKLIEQMSRSTAWRLTSGIDRMLLKIVPAESAFKKGYDGFVRGLQDRAEEACRRRENRVRLRERPLISIMMPTYNTDPRWLNAAVASVKQQSYAHWELCIADDGSTRKETLVCLREIRHPKIKVKFLPHNEGISSASNAAVAMAGGDYLAFLDHDDELAPDALLEIVLAINQGGFDLLYCDEDVVTEEGQAACVYHKPEYAPDYLLEQNYITHFLVCRRDLFLNLKGFQSAYDGAQDYDFLLRAVEQTSKIRRIPKVLYHWRLADGSVAKDQQCKSQAWKRGQLAIEAALRRRGIEAEVSPREELGLYRVRRKLVSRPLVTIIIPFRDQPDVLWACVQSILKKSTYSNYEIIGMNNDSVESETRRVTETLQAMDRRVRFYDYPGEFNYSAINNNAVANFAKGEVLILLNNDIEIESPDWIEAMLQHAQRPEVGAVGAKLFFPDGRLQHVGVVISNEKPVHIFRGAMIDELRQQGRRAELTQNYCAVTGACLMIRKALYEQMNGLNEAVLKIAFNDIDFCLRLYKAGYVNVFTPEARMIHYESLSRGQEDTSLPTSRFHEELSFLKTVHADLFSRPDPYYNPNLDELWQWG